MKWRWLAVGVATFAAGLALLWLARAFIAAEFARDYFRSHGVTASVEIGRLGLSGATGRFALGPDQAPDFSAERIELVFDPLRWTPYVTEVRLIHPLVRAQITAGGQVTLGSLQAWLDSLHQQQGKSRFISDDLIVSLTGLRALLATPAGAAEIDGDVKLVKNLPVSADLTLRPGQLTWNRMTAQVKAGRLRYDNMGHVFAHITADIQGKRLDIRQMDADLKAGGLRWSFMQSLSVSLSSADLVLSAADVNGVRAGLLKAAITNFSYKAGNASLSSADLVLSAAYVNGARGWPIKIAVTNFSSMGGAVSADMRFSGGINAGVLIPAPHTGDARLDRALAANLTHWDVRGAGHLALQRGRVTARVTTPLEVAMAKGASLTLRDLEVKGDADSAQAGFHARLHGGGLPEADVQVDNLVWSGGGFTAHAALRADFDYAMLRRAYLAGAGLLSWQSGRYAFTAGNCFNIRLAAFHPSNSDLAKDMRGEVCGTGLPLLSGEGTHWRLSGEARHAQAFLPLANSQLDNVSAKLAFKGEGADFDGQAIISQSRVSDKTIPLRFRPLLGKGTAALAGGVWRGRLAMASEKNQPLGDVTFTHTMASGAGSAHILAPKLTFAIDALQPEDLSPLLAAFRRSEGAADFTGEIGWTRDMITSRGTLAINSLDFLTPLGKAHAVKTRLEFTSLLPPQTAPGQQLTISRVDWILPFSAVDLRFSFSPASIKVDALSSGWAEGHASLAPFTIAIANPTSLAGSAELKSIALGSLITASNLGAKVKLEGKISGRIPFTTGADGIRITKGHIAADGPGRLSVDRSVWMQGDAAINSNAVQDFAYQALENLAFDSLSADLNSVANGQLQVVFHIKGKSDPPKPQTADVAIADILNGTALYKPIPLPSGTPVDLTLDTSLNFDELLKSYAEAWSKALSPEGHPDAGAGAKR